MECGLGAVSTRAIATGVDDPADSAGFRLARMAEGLRGLGVGLARFPTLASRAHVDGRIRMRLVFGRTAMQPDGSESQGRTTRARTSAADRAGFVLHGHSTGALKLAVRRHLASMKLVARSRAAEPDEGGDAFSVFWFEGADDQMRSPGRHLHSSLRRPRGRR